MKIFFGLIAAVVAVVALATNETTKIDNISPHSGALPDCQTWEPDIDKLEILCELRNEDFSRLKLD